MSHFDTILRDGYVFGHGLADIGIIDGQIALVRKMSNKYTSTSTVHCEGLTILPGVIDSHVHFREPGLTHKEDMETGSRAAVLGGVTGVFEMPNTIPPTSTIEALEEKLKLAQGRMHCNYAFYFGATTDNAKLIPIAEKMDGCAGVKVFMGSSTGTLLVPDDESLAQVLRAATRRVSVHAEDEGCLEHNKPLRVKGDPSSHPTWRDKEVALKATQRLVRVALAEGKKVHVLHVSTGEELDFLNYYKAVASTEVTPHHLTLDEHAYADLGNYAQMNPPIRDWSERWALWNAINRVDVIGSDHAPHARDEKDKVYPDSPSGMPGVQTLVTLMLNHVNAGRMSLETMVRMTSQRPAELFGLKTKGQIAKGFDADLTIVDLNREETISNKWIASKCGWTPYDGMKVRGWPVGTMVGGHLAMWEGTVNQPMGKPIVFGEGA